MAGNKVWSNKRKAALGTVFIVWTALLILLLDQHSLDFIFSKGSDNMMHAFSNILRESQLSADWSKHRQDMLHENVFRKVLFLSYMRGGSSIGGQIFNIDPNAVLWSLEHLEQQKLADFASNIFNCAYKSLPPETMSHHFLHKSNAMLSYMSCLKDMDYSTAINNCNTILSAHCGLTADETLDSKCHLLILAALDTKHIANDGENMGEWIFAVQKLIEKDDPDLRKQVLQTIPLFLNHRKCVETIRNAVTKCLPIAESMCQQRKIHVMEVNRMKMEDVEQVLIWNPDMYVIHYVRDPRAIALSREATRTLMWDKIDKRPVREAQFLCHRMRGDLQHRRILEVKYPGSFLGIRYEDLVQRPVAVAAQIYRKLNQTVPVNWANYSVTTMHSETGGSTGHFGKKVKNATCTSTAWQRYINRTELREIDVFCGDLIQDLG